VRAVVWSQAGLDDLDSIIDYIAADNAAAASKVAGKIETTADGLGRRPIGHPGRVGGTYEKSVIGLPYIIAYALQMMPSGEEQVVILRVIHTARNWPKDKWPK
jgi:toxin ParE1/3/4